MVLRATCKRSVKAFQYDTHCYMEEVNKEEMHTVVHKMLGTSLKVPITERCKCSRKRLVL